MYMRAKKIPYTAHVRDDLGLIVNLFLLLHGSGFADAGKGLEERIKVGLTGVIDDRDGLRIEVADKISDAFLEGYILHDLVTTALTVYVARQHHRTFVRLFGGFCLRFVGLFVFCRVTKRYRAQGEEKNYFFHIIRVYLNHIGNRGTLSIRLWVRIPSRHQNPGYKDGNYLR